LENILFLKIWIQIFLKIQKKCRKFYSRFL